jgi:Prefoldin subunit
MAGPSDGEGEGGQRAIKIDSLHPEQLQSLSNRLRSELAGLQQSATALSSFGNEFRNSKLAIEEIAGVEDGSIPCLSGLCCPLVLPILVTGRRCALAAGASLCRSSSAQSVTQHVADRMDCSVGADSATAAVLLMLLAMMLMLGATHSCRRQERRPGWCHAGQQMLVPMTEALYVIGAAHKPKQVMVDIGTGYFVEVSATLLYLCAAVFTRAVRPTRCCSYARGAARMRLTHVRWFRV